MKKLSVNKIKISFYFIIFFSFSYIILILLKNSISLPSWFSGCENNLKCLAIACDMYFTDFGEYPENLNILVEKRYIRYIPICEASCIRNQFDRVIFLYTGKNLSKPYMSYIYKRYKEYDRQNFIIYCKAKYHVVQINEEKSPMYLSRYGIVDDFKDIDLYKHLLKIHLNYKN